MLRLSSAHLESKLYNINYQNGGCLKYLILNISKTLNFIQNVNGRRFDSV